MHPHASSLLSEEEPLVPLSSELRLLVEEMFSSHAKVENEDVGVDEMDAKDEISESKMDAKDSADSKYIEHSDGVEEKKGETDLKRTRELTIARSIVPNLIEKCGLVCLTSGISTFLILSSRI